MTVKKRIPITALLGLMMAVAAMVMAAMAVMGYRSDELHFVAAIQDFERAAYTAVAALILSLAGVWIARPSGARRGMLPSLLGLLLSLPLVVFIIHFEYAASAYPPINDISTDTEDPPTF